MLRELQDTVLLFEEVLDFNCFLVKVKLESGEFTSIFHIGLVVLILEGLFHPILNEPGAISGGWRLNNYLAFLILISVREMEKEEPCLGVDRVNFTVPESDQVHLDRAFRVLIKRVSHAFAKNHIGSYVLPPNWANEEYSIVLRESERVYHVELASVNLCD